MVLFRGVDADEPDAVGGQGCAGQPGNVDGVAVYGAGDAGLGDARPLFDYWL